MSNVPSATRERGLSFTSRSAPSLSSRRPDVAPLSRLSFEQVYEGWQERVARWVRTLGARRADCDDLVQEVFTIAYRRFGSFDGLDVSSWLYQITRRKVRDYRRSVWVQRFHAQESLHDPAAQAEPGPFEYLEHKRQSQLAGWLLQRLSSDQRAAFVWFELEGRSGVEIAELQTVPINTVWARIYKARLKLQRGARERMPARANGSALGVRA